MPSLLYSSFLLTTLGSGLVSGLAHLPPRVSGDAQLLGHTKDAPFTSKNFVSDGGAGGKINGFNLITLSDASFGSLPIVHTVYAAFGMRDSSDPTEITMIADYANQTFYRGGRSDGNGGVVAYDDSDDPSITGPKNGLCFGPGPNTMAVRIPGNDTGGITVWTVYNACTNTPLYTTLIELDVQNPDTLNRQGQNIPAQRSVLRLHTSGQEPLYGQDGLATDGTWYFLLAQDQTLGFKMARVKVGARTNRNAYEYYYPGDNVWNRTVHTLGDASTNVYTPPSLGGKSIFGSDIFYSPYFQTWLITDSSADSFGIKRMQFAYSTSGIPEGPYKDAGVLFSEHRDSACGSEVPFEYLLHSHPGWDESGETLLVSWNSCDKYTDMAILKFAD